MAEEPKNRRRPGRSPWLKIARAVPLSFDVRKVLLGTVALLSIQAVASPMTESAATSLLALGREEASPLSVSALGSIFGSALWRITEPPRVLIEPMLALFSYAGGVAGTGRALLAVLWAILIMGTIGCAIARSAVREVAEGERASLVESLRFAFRSSRALIAAPLFPIGAAALCGLLCAGVGLLYRLPVVGGILAVVTLPVALALGFVMAVLLIDLAAAWPLIHVSVAADAENSLDVLSRAFGYVNRRPIQFAGCAAAAWFAGALGLFAVEFLALAALRSAAWGLSFTAPPEIIAGLCGPGLDVTMKDALLGTAPVIWAGVVQLLVRGWIYGYYWSAATMIYLLLRRNVDGVPFTEIKADSVSML